MKKARSPTIFLTCSGVNGALGSTPDIACGGGVAGRSAMARLSVFSLDRRTNLNVKDCSGG